MRPLSVLAISLAATTASCARVAPSPTPSVAATPLLPSSLPSSPRPPPDATTANSPPAIPPPLAADLGPDAATPRPTETANASEAAPELRDRRGRDRGETSVTPAPRRTYHRVLSAGDSFNGAFSLALKKMFEHEGARFIRSVRVGFTISRFASDPDFAAQVRSFDPDLVLINLGANDLDSHDPEATARYAEAIVKTLGTRDCYWIAPALWKKDTGIVDALARAVAPCRYFDSKGFTVERGRDGWHPSVAGGAFWAEQ